MGTSQFWIPKKNDTYSKGGNKIGTGSRWFSDKIYNGGTTGDLEFTDAYTNSKETAWGKSGGTFNDKFTNLGDIYLDTGYARLCMQCKTEKHISFHWGVPNGYNPDASIKAHSQFKNPGAYGVTFRYRWPNDNDVNYWSNSPVHIYKMWFHYVNSSNGLIFTYKAKFGGADASSSNHYPDRYKDDSGRRSNTFKNAYYTLDTGKKNKIIADQHMMVGMTWTMQYSDRGSSKHVRCMDVGQLCLIYDSPGNSNIIYQERHTDPFNGGGPRQILMI